MKNLEFKSITCQIPAKTLREKSARPPVLILVVSDDCTVKNEIKVVFNTKEQADGLKGMCFSWE